MKRYFILVLVLTLAGPCFGQRLQERIDNLRQQQRELADEDTLSVRQRMSTIIDVVNIESNTARDSFQWWSDVTGVPLVINWEAMSAEGIDPDQPINLKLRTVPATQLLSILMQQAAGSADLPDSVLLAERTKWYVQIMTRREANRHPVIRVYDVRDMLMTIPSFSQAPSFDLNEALSNTGSGGGGGGGGGGSSSGIFQDEDSNNAEQTVGKQQRGENLTQIVRDSIEPDLWLANGGDVASVSYFDGRLIVRAPMYVQRQIGIPSVSPRRRALLRSPSSSARSGRSGSSYTHRHRRSGISSVQRGSQNVSGTR